MANEQTHLLGNGMKKVHHGITNGGPWSDYGGLATEGHLRRLPLHDSLASLYSRSKVTVSEWFNTDHRLEHQTPDEESHDPAFPTLLNPVVATKKSSKLGVFSGVFVPCVLSIWGIILFLRFGFIIGQAGVMGTMAMFIVGYAINIFTTLSLSAISTNGTVRGR